MDKQIFDIVNQYSEHSLILTCEHAGYEIPEEYCNLGIDVKMLDTHIARDKGCKEITEKIAENLGCFAIMGKYSRLLVDLNRRSTEDELIIKESDKVIIPKNKNVDAREYEKRLKFYYYPYYEAIEKQIDYLRANGKKPIIFSIHSYTPQLKGGNYRPWHAGILYHKPTKLSEYLYQGLVNNTDKNIGENVPYDLRKYNTGAVIICGEEKGLDYALIEIRDDEFVNLESGVSYWANQLIELLKNYT